MTAGIYLIQCAVDNRVYVGSSINIENRWNQHLCNLRNNRHHSSKLQNAWNIYGEAAFECFLLERVTELEKLTTIEQKYIDHYNSFVDGYNASQFARKTSSSQEVVSIRTLTIKLSHLSHEALLAYCQMTGKTPEQIFTEYIGSLPVVSGSKDITLNSLLEFRQQTLEKSKVDPWEKLAEKYGNPSKKIRQHFEDS